MWGFDYCLIVRSDSIHRIQESQDAVGLVLWERVQAFLEVGMAREPGAQFCGGSMPADELASNRPRSCAATVSGRTGRDVAESSPSIRHLRKLDVRAVLEAGPALLSCGRTRHFSRQPR